jgi:hypothetical protein
VHCAAVLVLCAGAVLVLCAAVHVLQIDKHPLPAYNGVYRTIETHEGFPRYENAQGRQLYRYIPGEMWCLHGEFTPRINHCNAAIDSPLGNIPLGDQDWLVWTNGAHVMTTLNVSTIATAEEASKLWMKYAYAPTRTNHARSKHTQAIGSSHRDIQTDVQTGRGRGRLTDAEAATPSQRVQCCSAS